MFQSFFNSKNGSIAPVFMVLLPMLTVAMGVSIDLTRMIGHKGKLQSATDLAVLAAMQDAKSTKGRTAFAHDFITANMPGVEIKTRSIMQNGEIVFQALSKFETPILAMIGKPSLFVEVSTSMPRGNYDSNGKFIPVSYSSKQLSAIRRQMDKMVKAAPPEYREYYRKEYDRYYENLRRNRRKSQ